MEVEAALRTLNDTLGWTGSATLGNTLAGLTAAAYILWFAWITVSQMGRLRAGEANVDILLAEIGRALAVVFGLLFILFFLV